MSRPQRALNWVFQQISKLSPTDWVQIIGWGSVGGLAVWSLFAGWFSSSQGPWFIPAAAIVIASTMLIAERVSAWRVRERGIERSDRELRNDIWEWIREDSFETTDTPDKDVHFRFRVTGSGVDANVIRTKADPEFLVFTAHYTLEEKLHPVLDELLAFDDSTLIEDMQIELAHFKIGWSGLGKPLYNAILTDRMTIDRYLTKVRFTERLIHISSANVALHNLIRREARRRRSELTPPTQQLIGDIAPE